MKVKVNLAEKSYEVFINEPLKLEFTGKVAIISNSKVAGLHLNKILNSLKALQVFIVSIPDGEKYKNLASIEAILEQLFVSKLDRNSTLIALGGGVISDMTGFAASIYERGIDFVNIPTTLLAQVDASVGGKTGVNNEFGKNLIGTFYQPKAVFCDTSFLSTLPKREFAAGMAEVIKIAVAFDVEFFEFLQNADLQNLDLEKIITKCVAIKADIVSRDEKESGIRALLNYGHTFAHVIENETKYSLFLHGEAVAIGISMANRLSRNLGLLSQKDAQKIDDLILKFGLPINYRIHDAQSFYEAFFLDKKSLNGEIKFILADKIGSTRFVSDLPKDAIIDVLKAYE